MTVLDANLLLYAYNADSPKQQAASSWLSELLASGETVAIPWITAWAFVRISTNSRIWSHPRPAGEAFAILAQWLDQPGVVSLNPGPRHRQILSQLVTGYGAIGPLVTDAALAALAIENGAILATTDQGFSRFEGLRWVNPLSP